MMRDKPEARTIKFGFASSSTLPPVSLLASSTACLDLAASDLLTGHPYRDPGTYLVLYNHTSVGADLSTIGRFQLVTQETNPAATAI